MQMTRLSLFHWMMATLLTVLILSGCAPQPQKTIQNLDNANQSEWGTSHRYACFAHQARTEGYPNIGNLLDALACSEDIHSKHIHSVLKQYGMPQQAFLSDSLDTPVHTTIENLLFSINAKTYIGQTAFPIFASTAANEYAYSVETLFHHLTLVAQRHAMYCHKALQNLLQDKTDLNVVGSWSVCPQCGCVYITASLEENCVVCGEPAGTFYLFQ